MNIIFAFIITFLSGMATFIGGLIIFFKPSNINKYLTFALSLTTSTMILISLTDLLPESFKMLFPVYKYYLFIITIIIFIISIILYKIIIRFIDTDNKLYQVGIVSMIILIMHNVPEGIITFFAATHSRKLGIKLAVAIALHNIPEGIAISLPIYYGKGSKRRALLNTLLAGLSEPIGGLLMYLVTYKFITNEILFLIMLSVGIIMIILAIEEIFPEAKESSEGDNKFIFLGFLVGFIIVLVNLLIN